MKTYVHENIKYWYDPHIRMWTVMFHIDEPCEYHFNKTYLKLNYPEFKFIEYKK